MKSITCKASNDTITSSKRDGNDAAVVIDANKLCRVKVRY